MFTIGFLALYIGIIACLTVFCSCQGSTGMASSGYHSFLVQSRSGQVTAYFLHSFMYFSSINVFLINVVIITHDEVILDVNVSGCELLL